MNQKHSLATKLLTLFIPFCVACSGGDDDGGDNGTGGMGGGGGGGATNPWDGKTYLVEMKNCYWTEPRGEVVLDFAPYVPGFLLEVSGASTSSYDVKVATLLPNADRADPPPAA